MQHCVQTALAPSGELWSLAAEAGWLFTGGAADPNPKPNLHTVVEGA